MLKPDLSFFENTVDPDQMALRSHLIRIYTVFHSLKYMLTQGFSLASAIGHSPKIVPDVREFAVQFGQFVRDDFQKCILYGNAQ